MGMDIPFIAGRLGNLSSVFTIGLAGIVIHAGFLLKSKAAFKLGSYVTASPVMRRRLER